MALTPTGYVNQAKLAHEVARAALKLGPEVVLLRHSVGTDTSGEPSIFFRIVLRDSAIREETLADVTARISQVLFDELHPYENWDLRPHFTFRSQSEYEKLNDPAWA
jgi:hypothetical protein